MRRKGNGVGPLFPDGKKPKAAADNSTARVEAHFQQRWAETWPGIPLVDYAYGRDRKLLKGLIAKLGEPGAMALIDDFFDAVLTDPVVSRVNNPNVVALVAQSQYLLLRKQRKKPHPRTAENMAEAKKAMGK